MKSIEERLQRVEAMLNINELKTVESMSCGCETYLSDSGASKKFCPKHYPSAKLEVKPVEKKSLAQELRDSWVGSGIGWSKLDADVKGDWERLAQRAKELILDVDKEKLIRTLHDCAYDSYVVTAERIIEFLKSEAEKL